MALAKKSKKNVKAKAKAKPAPKAAIKSKAAKSAKPAKSAKAPTKSKLAKPVKASKPAPVAKTKANVISAKPKASSKTNWDSEITPLDDRLIVKIEVQAEKTAGGLYIPSTVSQERPSRGTVLAVGRGHRNPKGKIKPMDVKEGDEVLFAAFSGTEMKIQGQDVVILREADLLGIVD